MASLIDFATDSERQTLAKLAAERGQSLDDLMTASNVVTSPLSAYDQFKRRQAERARKASLTGRDIGEVPAVVDPARRAASEASFRVFCEVHCASRFPLAWSEDHLVAIDRIEKSVRHGGLFALAMPRGNGKTTLAEAAALWATLTGLRRFVLVVAANSKAAKAILKSLKTELESNDLLAADWPEAIHAIRSLEGISHKCKGQLFRGQQTCIEWGSEAIVLPRIDGAACSQAIIKVAGLLSADVRGSKHKMASGQIARPDFVISDDPQTDNSARSERETDTRKRIIAGGLLGVAGPGKTIAGVMPCTVIRRGDLADFVLDRKLSPHWHGEKFRMLHGTPDNQKRWDEYYELLTAELANGGDGSQATAFYREHQATLDAGLRASWSERKLPAEASAIQHAMNLRMERGPEAFDAEFQNDPKDTTAAADLLTAEQITRKQSPTGRAVCSIGTQHVTSFVDVQDEALFHLSVAWTGGFSGTVLDYGVYPQFGRTQFRLADLQGLLARTYPGLGQEARWHRAIVELASHLATKEWQREDGTTVRASKVLVDSAYGKSTDTVYEAVRACGVAAVQCSRGKYYGASSQPMSDLNPKLGRRMGVHWFEDRVDGRQTRCITIDTNWWKSFVQSRLSTPLGDHGSLTIYNAESYQHATLAEHLTAEFRTRTFGRGREVDEWKIRPDRPDNHWLDCLVGCAVGASMSGLSVEGGKASRVVKPSKSIDFGELQRQARARRQ